jgi:uracil-DNA glycosylase family 4
MLLGEAPGAEEDASGTPFVGTAGRILNECLQLAGIRREDVFIANAARCRPPGNRTPTQQETNACLIYTAEDILELQPKVILCLGGAALKALTGKDGVAANRGKQIPPRSQLRIGDAKVFVTYHPASLTHNRNPAEQKRIREAIAQDLRLATSLVENKPVSDHKKALLPEGYSLEQLGRGLQVLEKCKVVACDLEWTALKDRDMSWPWTRGAELYTISLSGRLNGTILSLAFSWPPPEGGEELLRSFFKEKPTVFHNALADLNWLDHIKIPVRLAGDTLILAYLMDEEQRLKLDQLAPLHTDVKPGWKVGPWDKRPITEREWLEILEYNCEDTYATLKLAEALHTELEKLPDFERDGIKKIYYNLLLPVIPTMVSMALTGIPMDEIRVAYELDLSFDRTKDIVKRIADIIGCSSAQAASLAGSPMQTLEYLKSAYHLDVDTSRKDDLVGYEDLYPVIPLIQKFRWERNKVQGTYLGPWLNLLREQGDGRLHSVYRLTYARTGRTSAEIEKGGSLQLMPREMDSREIKIRHLVKARPGYKIVAADQSQIELRVMAWFANDTTMISLLKEGADLHSATAAFIKSGISLEEFWPRRESYMQLVIKDERQGAKGVNFGLVFGLQPDGLMVYSKNTYKVDMTLEQAIHAHDSYFKMYYGVKAYHDYCRKVVFPRGYTETPFGRFRRHLEDPNKAINTPVQATASDLTLLGLHRIDATFKERGWPAYVCGFVHDSVICEVREDYVDASKEVVVNCLENPDLRPFGIYSLPVPLKVDILVGDSWGEAS